MTRTQRILSLDREDMSLSEKALCLKDLKRVLAEYFELTNDESLEITRTDDGFLVCLLFSARRIKGLKTLD